MLKAEILGTGWTGLLYRPLFLDVRSDGGDVNGEGDVGTSVEVGSPPPSKRRKNDKETSKPVEGDNVNYVRIYMCTVLYTVHVHVHCVHVCTC